MTKIAPDEVNDFLLNSYGELKLNKEQMSSIVVAADTTAMKLIKIYEADLMQDDKDNFKKAEINAFKKLGEEEVRQM